MRRVRLETFSFPLIRDKSDVWGLLKPFIKSPHVGFGVIILFRRQPCVVLLAKSCDDDDPVTDNLKQPRAKAEGCGTGRKDFQLRIAVILLPCKGWVHFRVQGLNQGST
jgi:hypothetical protein